MIIITSDGTTVTINEKERPTVVTGANVESMDVKEMARRIKDHCDMMCACENCVFGSNDGNLCVFAGRLPEHWEV